MRDSARPAPIAAAARAAPPSNGVAASRGGRVPRDPFTTRAVVTARRFDLLGGRFEFRAADPRLLAAVDAAYAGVPAHRFGPRPPAFELELLSHRAATVRRGAQPAPLGAFGQRGFLGGAAPGSEYVMLWPEWRRGVIVAAGGMLNSGYHLRYEMVEFAVFTLAARVQSLAPLHAACVSRGAHAALLIGDSGAGKSTLSLACLLRGLDFIAEDAVFVEPASLRATGVANFLHLQRPSLRWVEDDALRRGLASAPRIRRRSGVEKLEIDLRQPGFALARKPAALTSLLFLSRQAAGRGSLLTPLAAGEVERRLLRSQPYARGQAGWPAFLARARALPAFELRRGTHPDLGAAAIGRLLCASH